MSLHGRGGNSRARAGAGLYGASGCWPLKSSLKMGGELAFDWSVDRISRAPQLVSRLRNMRPKHYLTRVSSPRPSRDRLLEQPR